MFDLFGSLRSRPRTSPPRRARPSLEQLEDRFTPAAPSISDFTATHIGSYLAIEGKVTDETPATTSVALGGAVSATVTPDASGWFNYVTSWNNGTQVTAQAHDSQQLDSAQLSAAIANPSDANPFIRFSISYGQQRQITVTGQFIDEQPANRIVIIGGSASGSATTDATGSFSITLTADSLGQVTAWGTDIAGHVSNTAIRTLQSAVPVIQQFSVSEKTGGWYEFSGRVVDECPFGLTVDFGGQPVSLSDQTVTVGADGWFHFQIKLNGTTTDEGTATAVVSDWWGLTSNTATCLVHQTGVG